jgi:hypothetical protein
MKNPINKDIFKSGIITFISILLIFIFMFKFLGSTKRSTGAYYEPSSWFEIYLNLPLLTIGSFMLTVVYLWISKEGDKYDKRNLENARKRIEERERKEKELKSEDSENGKEENDKTEKM